MKRCISLVLSVLIVLASITSALSFPVSAEGENTSTAIVVEDFESETLDPAKWTTPDSSKCIVSDGLLSQAPGGAIFHELSATLESVEYSVSFDYKIVDVATITDNNNLLGFFRVGFINDNDTLYGSDFAMFWTPVTTSNRTKTDWQSFSTTITPDSSVVAKATRFVIGSVDDNFNSTILIDNIRVCKKEDAATLTAAASAGGTVNGVSGTYKKATVKGDSVTLTATANTGYKFMGWYDNSATYPTYDSASLKSSNLTYVVDLTSDVKLKAIFVKEIVDGVLFDFDFTDNDLSECEIYKQVTTSNFAPKSAEDGSYVEGNQGASLQKAVSLKANVKYTMTFDFRFMSDTELGNTDFYRAGFTKSYGTMNNDNKASEYYKIYGMHGKTPAGKYTTKNTHTYEFTPTTDLLVYAVIGQYSDTTAGFEIYNWKLTAENVTVTTVAEGRGSVNEVGSVPFGTQTTVTATPDVGYKFAGWYNGEIPVSTDAEYTFTAEEPVTLTAKFKLDENAVVSNYIVNGDFETQPNTGTIYAPSSYDPNNSEHVAYFHTTGVWGRIMSGVTRMDWTASSVADTENGTHYLTSGATDDDNQFIRAFGQFVQLPAGDYELTFIAKSNNSSYFVAGVYSQPSVTSGTAIAKLSLSESEIWQNYVLNFTIDKTGYYQIAFGGNNQGLGEITFAIDNVVLTRVDTPSMVTTNYDSKAAIRAAGNTEGSVNKDGLRIYNKIANDFAANYIVEYGSIAIREAKLGGSELTLNTSNAVKGIAYQEPGVNKIWRTESDGVVFTSYLTGISPKYYGADYAVRSYAKDKYGNIYYGDTITICIYDVVWAIKKAQNDDRADTVTTNRDISTADTFIGKGDAYEADSYKTWCVNVGKDNNYLEPTV